MAHRNVSKDGTVVRVVVDQGNKEKGRKKVLEQSYRRPERIQSFQEGDDEKKVHGGFLPRTEDPVLRRHSLRGAAPAFHTNIVTQTNTICQKRQILGTASGAGRKKRRKKGRWKMGRDGKKGGK